MTEFGIKKNLAIFFNIQFLLLLYTISPILSQSLMDGLETVIWFYTIWQIKKGRVPINYKFLKPIVLVFSVWFVGILISSIPNWSTDPIRTLKAVLEWRWMITFIWLVIIFYNQTASWFEEYFRRVSLVGLVIVAINLIQFFLRNEGRAEGFVGIMGLSNNLVLILGFFLGLLNKVKWASWGAMITSGLLLATLTRGAWLGAIVAAMIFLYIAGSRRLWRKAGVIITTVLLLVFYSPLFRPRLEAIRQGDPSVKTRLLFWKGNWKMFLEKPLFGWGYGVNRDKYFEFLSPEEQAYIVKADPGLMAVHAHNQYLHFLSGLGLWGCFSFLIFVGLVLWPYMAWIWRNGVSKLKIPIAEGFANHRSLAEKESDQTPHLSSRFEAVYWGLYAGAVGFLCAAMTESVFSISKNRTLFLIILSLLYVRSLNKDTSDVHSRIVS